MLEMVLAATLVLNRPELPQQLPTAKAEKIEQAAQLPEVWRGFAACVSERESGGSYRAKNPTSSAQGRYQFLDNSWRRGGAWNVWKQLIAHGISRADARQIRAKLMAKEIAKWEPVLQDVLFAQVLTSGEGHGWRHWYLAGSRCNSLVPDGHR